MKQSLLWRLSKDGHQESFVFGTMHVKSELAFGRSEQLAILISECDVFAAEYDLDVLHTKQSQGDMLIPDGLSMIDLLGESKFSRMQKMLAKSFAVDLNLFSRYLPLIIVNIISEAVLSQEHKVPLDLFLWRIASDRGLELQGIESYESQIQILKKIELKDQFKMVNGIVKNPQKFRRSIVKMAAWYEKEEIALLYKNGKKTLGKYKKILLRNRNYIMADRFEDLSAESKLFLAIGAGHLAGNNGVIKLLKEKGWKLEAL